MDLRTLRTFDGHSRVLGCALLIAGLAVAASSGFTKGRSGQDGWHTVASDQMGDPARRSHLEPGASFFAFDEPASSPLRIVAFGTSLSFGYGRLNPAAHYRVKLVFVSDGARTESVTVDGQPLIPKLDFNVGRVLIVEHDLPKPAAGTGRLRLDIHWLAGPNAVVSEVDILSTDSKPLTAIKPTTPSVLIPTVSPADLTKALPILTPRPDEGIADLSGSWQFSPSAPTGFEKAADHADWRSISVPGEWVMQGFSATPNTTVAYFRRFNLGSKPSVRRFKLRFSSV